MMQLLSYLPNTKFDLRGLEEAVYRTKRFQVSFDYRVLQFSFLGSFQFLEYWSEYPI